MCWKFSMRMRRFRIIERLEVKHAGQNQGHPITWYQLQGRTHLGWQNICRYDYRPDAEEALKAWEETLK